MWGSKGYRNYRGRRSKGKILLAILLCLVILAAAAVIFMQEQISFDESGVPHLGIPWREEAPEEEPQDPEELDLVVQEPSGAAEVHVRSLTETPLTRQAWESARDSRYNAYAVTAKDSSGRIYFDSQTAVSDMVRMEADTAAVLTELTAEDAVHTVARLSCFLDPAAARSDAEGMGLRNLGGYIFYDGNNLNWLDPSKEGTRSYLSGLAAELAELGFDEILLTDFSFPTEGKLDKIAYPEGGKEAALRDFLTAVRTALNEAGYEGVMLSVELPAGVIDDGRDETAGLVLADIAAAVERIYAVTTADRTDALSRAVADAGAFFVPELTAPAETGSYLLI